MLFISHQKLSRYLSFCLDFLVMQQNGLIRKIRLVSNFKRHSLVNEQLQYTYCPISSEAKAINQTMKFGHLIESSMRNIFLEKSFTQFSEKTSPKPFFEKLNLSISQNQQSKSFMQFVFIVCQVEGCRNILKLSCRPVSFTSYQAFLKIKRGLELVSPASFSA